MREMIRTTPEGQLLDALTKINNHLRGAVKGCFHSLSGLGCRHPCYAVHGPSFALFAYSAVSSSAVNCPKSERKRMEVLLWGKGPNRPKRKILIN